MRKLTNYCDSFRFLELFCVYFYWDGTWGEIADIYTELMGLKFDWTPASFSHDTWHWKYDRAYDRAVDNSKVLKATGLNADDFKSIKDGIRIELKKLGAI